MSQDRVPSCSFNDSTDDDQGRIDLQALIELCGGTGATPLDANGNSAHSTNQKCIDLVGTAAASRVTNGQQDTQFEKVAASMGLSETCKQGAASSFDQAAGSYSESYATASVSAKANAVDHASTVVITPFGGGGGGGWKASSKETESTTAAFDSASQIATNSGAESSFSSGCGAVELDMIEEVRTRNNLACTLRDNANNSETAVNSTATISIRSSWSMTSTEREALLAKKTDELAVINAKDPIDNQTRVLLAVTATINSNPKIDSSVIQVVTDSIEKTTTRAIAAQTEAIDAINDMYDKLLAPETTINNCTFVNRVGMKITQVQNITSTSVEKLKKEYKQIVFNEAKKQILKETDTRGAVSAVNTSQGIKSVLNSKIDEMDNDIDEDITKATNSTSNVINNGATIEIVAAGGNINISNTTFDNDIDIDLKVNQIVNTAKDRGRAIGTDLMTQVTDIMVDTSKYNLAHDGLKDIIKALPELKTEVRDTSIDPDLMAEMGAANADIVEKTGEMPNFSNNDDGWFGGFKLDLFWGGLIAIIAILLILRFIPILVGPTKFFVMIGLFVLLIYWIFAKLVGWFPFIALFGFRNFKNRRTGMAMRTMPVDPYSKMIFGHRERRTIQLSDKTKALLAERDAALNRAYKSTNDFRKEMRKLPSANIFEYSKMFNRKSNPIKHYKNKGPKAYR